MSTVDPEFMPDPDGGDHSPICPRCGGEEFVLCFWCGGPESDEYSEDCPVCEGVDGYCANCGWLERQI